MPLIIPPFVQYQAPIVPLRGLWNATPPEGDKMISCEVAWLNSPPGANVQFQFSGNSPVAISQIVALGVDNSRCGADATFVFSDSGSQLVVPARTQLVSPVFTNGLMFYCGAAGAILGDVTAFLVFNSMPPPVPIAAPSTQNHAAVSGVNVAVNGSTPLIPAGVNGTLNSFSGTIDAEAGASPGFIGVALQDGTGRYLWAANFTIPASQIQVIPINITGLALRFVNGVNLVISGSTVSNGSMYGNAYYSQP